MYQAIPMRSIGSDDDAMMAVLATQANRSPSSSSSSSNSGPSVGSIVGAGVGLLVIGGLFFASHALLNKIG